MERKSFKIALGGTAALLILSGVFSVPFAFRYAAFG